MNKATKQMLKDLDRKIEGHYRDADSAEKLGLSNASELATIARLLEQRKGIIESDTDQRYMPGNVPSKYHVGACTSWDGGKMSDNHVHSHFFFTKRAKQQDPLCPICGHGLQATTRRYQGEWFLLVDGVLTGDAVRTYETAQQLADRIGKPAGTDGLIKCGTCDEYTSPGADCSACGAPLTTITIETTHGTYTTKEDNVAKINFTVYDTTGKVQSHGSCPADQLEDLRTQYAVAGHTLVADGEPVPSFKEIVMTKIAANQTKTCKKCGVTKPITEFYKFAAGEYGVFHNCKDCYKAARAAGKSGTATAKKTTTKPAAKKTTKEASPKTAKVATKKSPEQLAKLAAQAKSRRAAKRAAAQATEEIAS